MAQNEGDQGESTRTSSRCIPEGATHDFEVTNYPLLDGMGIGKYISSGTFTVGGYDWNIEFYPDGNSEKSVDHASVFLCYLSQANDKVRTRFTLTMLDDQGNTQSTKRPHGYIFSPEKQGDWGFPKFVRKSKLKSLSHLLTIMCALTVIKEPPKECKSNLIVDPPPELPHRLLRTFKNGRGTDITLLVGGREFSTHKLILAVQLPVFDAQLFGPMMDKDTQRIEIVDMEPAIFEMLLHYVYTDSLPPCSEDDYDAATMQHLLVAADQYGMDRLKVMCENRLRKRIDVSTVTSSLALAKHHYCDQLEDACLEFISSSREVINAVMPSSPILDLQKNLLEEKVPIKRK